MRINERRRHLQHTVSIDVTQKVIIQMEYKNLKTTKKDQTVDCMQMYHPHSRMQEALTAYNKAIRKAKRDTGRRYCEMVDITCVKLQRILATKSKASEVHTEDYTKTGSETMAELLRAENANENWGSTAIADWRNLLTGQPELIGQFQKAYDMTRSKGP